MEVKKYKSKLIDLLKVIDEKSGIDRDYEWFGTDVYDTEERALLALEAAIANETPSGEVVMPEEIQEIETWQVYVAKSYKEYTEWINNQILLGDVYYYSKPNEDFFTWEAYQNAVRLGKRFLILENLS